MDGAGGGRRAARERPAQARRGAEARAGERPCETAPGRPGKRERLIGSDLDLPALFARTEEELGAPDLRQRQDILRSCRHAMQAGPPGPQPGAAHAAPAARPGAPLRGLLRLLGVSWRG